MAVQLFHKLFLFTNANSPRVPVDEISAQPQTLKTLLSTLPRAVLNNFFFAMLVGCLLQQEQRYAAYSIILLFKNEDINLRFQKPRLYLWGTGISPNNFITRTTRLSLGIRKHPDLQTFHLRSADEFTKTIRLSSTNT